MTHWDAALYDEAHSFVAAYGGSLVDDLDPRPGERILDLGCGTATLTAEIAARGAGVVGLDSSEEMLARGREEHPGLDLVHGDGADFSFAHPFDAVFSNAALHWVGRPDAAATCIARVLRAGGRFVAEFGGHGNVAALLGSLAEAAATRGHALRGAWYFPTIGEYAAVLERHGLVVTDARLYPRPTTLSGDDGLATWYRMFAGGHLADVPAADREAVIEDAVDHLRPTAFRDGTWTADYVRLRVRAIRG